MEIRELLYEGEQIKSQTEFSVALKAYYEWCEKLKIAAAAGNLQIVMEVLFPEIIKKMERQSEHISGSRYGWIDLYGNSL